MPHSQQVVGVVLKRNTLVPESHCLESPGSMSLSLGAVLQGFSLVFSVLLLCPLHHTSVIALPLMIGIPGLQMSSTPWSEISPRTPVPQALPALGECPSEERA